MNPNEIRFKLGEMQSFTATRTFTVSGPGGQALQVISETQVLFDGRTADYNGLQFPAPTLRGAIKAGWLVLTSAYEEGNPEYGKPKSANIAVSATDGGNPLGPKSKSVIATTETDERIVRGATAADASAKAGAGRKKMATQLIEPQEGIPVRTLKTPSGDKARTKRTTLTGDSARSTIAAVDDGAVIEPGRGVTEDEMLKRMSKEQREDYLSKKESLRSQYVDDQPQVVASVKTQKAGSSEGMTFQNHVGGGVEIYDPTTGQGKVKTAVASEEGITFRTTNGPEKSVHTVEASQPAAAPTVSADIRRKTAKALCPNFPDDYNFELPPKKKLARLMADYEDRPDIIRAVFAAETDEMRALLVQEFPQVFQG